MAPPRRRLGVTAAFLALAATLFVVHAWPMLGQPFGDSHDGRNGAMWAGGSRNLREGGPIDSRLGTVAPERAAYANHPPLIGVETAVAEVVGRATPASSRAPAWIGSLVSLFLLVRILTERGLRPLAAGAAVLLVAATPMFLIYGTMLDTPVTALPVGLGVVLLWLRARDGTPVRPALFALVIAAAVLSSWQALLMAALAAGWAGYGMRRPGPARRDPARVAAVVGFAGGLAVLVAWIAWAYGWTLQPLFDQYLFRAGRSRGSVGLGELLADQRSTLFEMFGAAVLLLGLAGLIVALRRPSTRPLAVVALAVTVPYTLLLPVGALNHDYWNFWFILPLTLGLAAGADALLGAATAVRTERLVPVAAVALALVMTAGALARPPAASERIRDGVAAGELLATAGYPEGQDIAWYAGFVAETPNWIGFAARRTARKAEDIRALAAARPDDVVFVGRCSGPDLNITYSLERAAAAAQRPPQEVCTP